VSDDNFEPRIITFTCNWCSYAGADLAGISRFQYPPSIRIIRVMCSGMLDPRMIFRAFRAGADGVLVTGCHPGDCHYISGNYHTKVRMAAVNRMVKNTGLEPERLFLEWVSASEGERFATLVTEFTDRIRRAGPLSNSKAKEDQFRAAEIAFASSRLRVLLGRELTLTEEENSYHEKLDKAQYDALVDLVVDKEYERGMIMHMLDGKNSSVVDIAKGSGIPSPKVLRHITRLQKKGKVALDKLEGPIPIYRLAGGALDE